MKKESIEEISKKILSLSEKLEKILNKIRKNYFDFKKEKSPNKEISETLITKIILGVIGCIPAYDRFFKEGIKKYNQNYKNKNDLIQNFSLNSIKEICKFYLENKRELEKIRNNLKLNKTYPLMKLIDSYFWKTGSMKK